MSSDVVSVVCVVSVVVIVVSVSNVVVSPLSPSPPAGREAEDEDDQENGRMMRPLIGITAYAEEASWGVWNVPAALTPLAYVAKVEAAGGRPLLVPPSDDSVAETLDVLDGLVFTGGPDLDPSLYGADAHPETKAIRPERDRAEIALLTAALARPALSSPSAAARRCSTSRSAAISSSTCLIS